MLNGKIHYEWWFSIAILTKPEANYSIFGCRTYHRTGLRPRNSPAFSMRLRMLISMLMNGRYHGDVDDLFMVVKIVVFHGDLLVGWWCHDGQWSWYIWWIMMVMYDVMVIFHGGDGWILSSWSYKLSKSREDLVSDFESTELRCWMLAERESWHSF